MRKRSESFYAKTSEEFSNVLKKEKSKKSKVTSLLDNEEDEGDNLGYDSKINSTDRKFNFYDDMDELGVEKTFAIMKNPPTLEEEELDLIDNISNLNNYFQAKDKDNFLTEILKIYKLILKEKTHEDFNSEQKKISRSLTFDSLNCLNVDFDLLKNLEDMASSSNSTNNSIHSILTDPIISKNINCVDDVLKFIFIGDGGVGKTFMINKLLNDKADRNVYQHTNSFGIKKINIKLLSKRIKLELFDTNVSIINSNVCHIYYKICDGIFLLFDPTRIETVYFIEKQIQNIIKTSTNTNFFFVANLTFLDLDHLQMKEQKKKFDESDKIIKSIVSKYDLRVHYINIRNLKDFKNQIRKYLSLTYIKKGLYDNDIKVPQKRRTIKDKNRNSLNFLRGDQDSNEILES